MTRQTIGAFLATQRKAHGYTQEEVADKLGISNRTLSKWETDRSSPDILYLPALADLYGVTVDEILRGERAKREEQPLSPEEQAKKEEQAQRAKRALQKRALASFVWEEEYNARFDADIPAGDYALDLSGIDEEAPTPVGSGFWAQRLENEAWIFASDSEASLPEGGESTISSDVQISQFILSAPFLGYTADGREVYSVRYGDMGLGGMVSIPVDVQYRFTESEGVYTVVEVRTYTVEDLVGGIYLAASCVGSAAMLILWNALRSRRKFAL